MALPAQQSPGRPDHDRELPRQKQGDTHSLKHRVRDIPEYAKQKWLDFGQGRPDHDRELTRQEQGVSDIPEERLEFAKQKMVRFRPRST